MDRRPISEIIKNIKALEPFEAVALDYSFTIKVEDYVPYVCAAIHDGHQFRKELWDSCLHTDYERWYEEDPETKTMIAQQPIVLAGCDSRFEYDLNRAPEDAIFETAWGKQLWRKPLSLPMKTKSLEKHANFYKVVHALVDTLETKFGCCTVYDMHSYNWKRWDREVPTWNLGTSNIDQLRYGHVIEDWRLRLSKIKFPYGIKSTSKVNDTFQGNGYFLKYITKHFKNTLVLATEIAKVYCDEYERVMFPEIVHLVAEHLKTEITAHANAVYNIFKG